MIATPPLRSILGVLAVGLVGWCTGGFLGAGVGLAIGAIVGVAGLRGRSPGSWLVLWVRRNRPMVLHEPVTVANDRAGGGVRCQGNVAAVAVQVLGKAHTPTLFTGSASARTDNTIDVVNLLPLLHQSLGLTLDSLSLVSAGARRRDTGDYSRVYDTLIGTPPYAGRRETWLIVRIRCLDNVEALRWRGSVGTAALAAGQRIGSALRQRGIRARVATATEIAELDRRLDAAALAVENRRWRSLRGRTGWWTTYGYRPGDITEEKLAQAWSLPADRIVGNVTLFPDDTVTATVTVASPQPPTAPPSMLLHTLPGQQASALAANLCGPLPALSGIGRAVLTGSLTVPVGPSGVLLGKADAGNRLLLPLDDPGEFNLVQIDADDVLTKRILVRLCAAGERITMHSAEPQRWASIRMPGIVVDDRARPALGTTVSVTDGTVMPAPRPNTVICLGETVMAQRESANVLITQTDTATLRVSAAGQTHIVEMELFRAENRYAPTADSVLAGMG